MSAFALQILPFYPSQRPISEVELLRAIGRITWNAASEEPAFKSIAAAILRVSNLTGFRFEPAETEPSLPLYEAAKPQSAAGTAWAFAPVSANGKSWGQLRIFFKPHSDAASESPVRLAKFVGQQIAILLDRLDAERRNRLELARRQALERGIRLRKAVHRAAAILATQRGISVAEATRILVQYARRNRTRLLHISESLIFGFDALTFTRPTLRRLSPNETTAPDLQRSIA